MVRPIASSSAGTATRLEGFGRQPGRVGNRPGEIHHLVLIVELDERQAAITPLPLLVREELVESADHVRRDRLHRAGAIEDHRDISLVFHHAVLSVFAPSLYLHRLPDGYDRTGHGTLL